MNDRKKEHIDICLKEDVESVSTGFEKFRFVHNALPEIDFDEINTSCEFLGRKLGAPIIISPMTGGAGYEAININLAKAAEKCRVAMSVGSQRILFEDKSNFEEFNIRKYCPGIPLIANLGAVQLNYGFSVKESKKAVEMIMADALSLHLNPMQEALQKEGQKNFKGLLPKIKEVNDTLGYPLIIKEVGFGISSEVGNKLKEIGVKYIDVAGTGGTNFSIVEGIRNKEEFLFKEWGISTYDSLIANRDLGITIIASGGIRTGLDIAKALALGADYCGIALPLLKAAAISEEAVIKEINKIVNEIKITMFCIGVKTISELKNSSKIQN
jgi:isopentenyl-diphosphate delta-isomerase